jgi:cyclase
MAEARAGFTRGLHEVGEGFYAYLQPDGSWGWSNAGLVAGGESAVLIDTLFDLRLTESMLCEMRRAVPAAAQIETLVNTHGNGDHCFGNQLLAGSRIVATEQAAAEMSELPPAAMAALVAQAPQMGELGEFFLRCFSPFDFEHIELTLPSETFSGELELSVEGVELSVIEVGPAHTRGDALVHAPGARVLFSGDILFSHAHPIAWAGPVSHWIAACDRNLALDVAVIVPGHGPIAGPDEVRELRAYFEYLYEHARASHSAGMSALQAARALAADRWAGWGEAERLVVNLANIYAEIDAEIEALTPLEAFQQMAELARDAPTA